MRNSGFTLLSWLPAALVGVVVIAYNIIRNLNPSLVCQPVNPPDGNEYICGIFAAKYIPLLVLLIAAVGSYIINIMIALKSNHAIWRSYGITISTIILAFILVANLYLGNHDTP